MKTIKRATAALLIGFGTSWAMLATAGEYSGSKSDVFDRYMEIGAEIYPNACGVCHGDEAQGAVGPALGNNTASARALVRTMYNGFNAMPPVAADMTHEEIAALATYIRNSWGNEFDMVTEDEIEGFLAPIDF